MDARNDLALSVTTPSDREIVLTRTFEAPLETIASEVFDRRAALLATRS